MAMAPGLKWYALRLIKNLNQIKKQGATLSIPRKHGIPALVILPCLRLPAMRGTKRMNPTKIILSFRIDPLKIIGVLGLDITFSDLHYWAMKVGNMLAG